MILFAWRFHSVHSYSLTWTRFDRIAPSILFLHSSRWYLVELVAETFNSEQRGENETFTQIFTKYAHLLFSPQYYFANHFFSYDFSFHKTNTIILFALNVLLSTSFVRLYVFVSIVTLSTEQTKSTRHIRETLSNLLLYKWLNVKWRDIEYAFRNSNERMRAISVLVVLQFLFFFRFWF